MTQHLYVSHSWYEEFFCRAIRVSFMQRGRATATVFFCTGEKAQTVVSILKSSQNWVNLAFSKLGQNVFLVIVLVLIFMLVRAIITLLVRNYAAFEAEFLKVSKKKLIYFRSNIIFFWNVISAIFFPSNISVDYASGYYCRAHARAKSATKVYCKNCKFQGYPISFHQKIDSALSRAVFAPKHFPLKRFILPLFLSLSFCLCHYHRRWCHPISNNVYIMCGVWHDPGMI